MLLRQQKFKTYTMKLIILTIIILLTFTLTSSFQCNKCKPADIKLDNTTKSWFPFNGKTTLPFLDRNGAVVNFSLRVIDTTEVAKNYCGDSYRFEYLNISLYLNPAKTDSIHFNLASSGWLCMRATSENNPNIELCNMFGQAQEGKIAKRLYNYPVGGRNYPEVILIRHNQGFLDNIDSVYIANNVGIVGFKYSLEKFTLQ
jgi:hypothetical protein